MADDSKKRLTVDDLIARAGEKEKQRNTTKEIDIGGGVLEFRRPSDDMILELTEAQKKGDIDMELLIRKMAELLYNCCDEFHDGRFHEIMDTGDPVEAVYLTMDAAEIITVGEKVCSMNALYEEAGEIGMEGVVKNA